jgi:hypothetical protein
MGAVDADQRQPMFLSLVQLVIALGTTTWLNLLGMHAWTVVASRYRAKVTLS